MGQLQIFFPILQQLCDVLDFIHKHQIIHRDLKPQNILITQLGQLKLIDFGIMKVQDLTLYTNRNSFMGSAYYVAPECLSGDEVSPAADIFSLGVMIYDLLTGVKPFRGHTLAETVYQRLVSSPKAPSLIADLPKSLDPFFVKMLHLEPHMRHSSCKEVYDDLYTILAQHIPKVTAKTNQTEMDICTKSQFLHSLFMEECIPELEENKILYLIGPSGTGKDTIVENLPHHLKPDHVLKIDIQESLTPNDLMEIILSQLPAPATKDPAFERWLSILATALPQLNWKVPAISYQIHSSSILSAFLKVAQQLEKKTLILLTCVALPSKSLTQFLNHFLFFVGKESSSPVYVVFTSESAIPRLAHLIKPRSVPFPDTVTLCEHLSNQFNQARVPIDLATRLGKESGHHLHTFLKNVEKHKRMGILTVREHVLVLSEDSEFKTKTSIASETIPRDLSQFTIEQLNHLEWLALNPEGVDIGILKQLTQVNLETLSRTLTIAKEHDLLDFQTSSTQGLIWKKKKIRDFLLASLNEEEKANRSLILAETIQKVSKRYIQNSPPLWRVISALFLEGKEYSKATEYAMQYARYCFQSAQYESIRKTLSPLLDLPSLKTNHEFWFFIASAYRNEDSILALSFVKKAHKIRQNAKTKALQAIIEFDLGHYETAFSLLDHVFSECDLKTIDINLSTELVSLLIASDQITRAHKLLFWQEEKLKLTEDLYAQNLLAISKMQVLEQIPKKALAFSELAPDDLLPRTKIQILQLASFCHQSLFQFNEGESNLENLRAISECEDHHEHLMFLEETFFYLNFHQFKNIKKLLASEQAKNHSCLPLIHLTSQLMTGDPQVTSQNYILNCIQKSKLTPSTWLPLFYSLLDPMKLTSDMIESVLGYTKNNIPFWSRHQTPRFMLLKKLVDGQFSDVPAYLHMALKYAKKYNLPMESLRLEIIQSLLISEGILVDRIPNLLPSDTQQSAHTLQFLTSTLY